MEKVTPFLYKYIYFVEEKVVYRIDNVSKSTIVDGGITEALKDEHVDVWKHASVISGNDVIGFFKRKFPDSERKDWFFIEDRPFIPRGMVKKVLVAKKPTP